MSGVEAKPLLDAWATDWVDETPALPVVVNAPKLIAARALLLDATATFDKEIIAKLQAHVKTLLAPYEYPKDIEFIDQLPMTTTGKVQRRVLRLQEEARFKDTFETT